MGALFLLLFLLFGIGIVYPCGAFIVWLVGYRHKVTLKEFWKNV